MKQFIFFFIITKMLKHWTFIINFPHQSNFQFSIQSHSILYIYPNVCELDQFDVNTERQHQDFFDWIQLSSVILLCFELARKRRWSVSAFIIFQFRGQRFTLLNHFYQDSKEIYQIYSHRQLLTFDHTLGYCRSERLSSPFLCPARQKNFVYLKRKPYYPLFKRSFETGQIFAMEGSR